MSPKNISRDYNSSEMTECFVHMDRFVMHHTRLERRLGPRSTSMTILYSNALCNISATDAKDSNGGLFHRRNPRLFEFPIIKIPKANGEVWEACLVESSFWDYRLKRSALLKRAWVLQERFLAPRVINFDKDHLFWECQEMALSEKRIEMLPGLGHPIFKQDFLTAQNSGKMWKRITDSYSAGELTKGSDEEAAFYGIVKLFEAIWKDRCIVGLWESCLLLSLL